MKKIAVSLIVLFIVGFSPMQAATAGEVARAQFTSEVSLREPIDEIKILSNDINRISFFSELVDLQGQVITHRWQYAGKVMAEISFNVAGPRWRVNSSKTLLPGWIGDWSVAIVDEAGNVLSEHSFQHVETER